MIDLKKMIEAEKQLNQVWEKELQNIESKKIPNDIYNALYEVDEAISNLTEKVGEIAKVILISSIRK